MNTQEEFLSLIAGCQGMLQKVCSIYTNNSAEREDLFQDILYQLWKSFPAFDKERNVKFSTWVFRVAINTALTCRRNLATHISVVSLPDYQTIQDKVVISPEEYENRKLLYTAMQQLKEFDRALLLLSLEGYSYKEIEEITGITPNAIGVKLNRIRKELQKLISTF